MGPTWHIHTHYSFGSRWAYEGKIVSMIGWGGTQMGHTWHIHTHCFFGSEMICMSRLAYTPGSIGLPDASVSSAVVRACRS